MRVTTPALPTSAEYPGIVRGASEEEEEEDTPPTRSLAQSSESHGDSTATAPCMHEAFFAYAPTLDRHAHPNQKKQAKINPSAPRRISNSP